VINPHVLGISDPCPCRGGRTFGECCLRDGRATYQSGIPVIKVPNLPAELTEFLAAESRRQERFGEVLPVIQTDWRGYKFVAVGKRLLWSNKWKTPADFLTDYLAFILTQEWGQAELAKPLTARHPVMQWYDGMCRFKARNQVHQQASPAGLFAVDPSGAMRAYLLLAYDLYTLHRHSALQDRLVCRLRNSSQYQGARHELFAAATCIRAGFDIEHEDELDGASKHAEFTAVHLRTGARFSVEAKSRHRKGVLGEVGAREPDTWVRIRVGHLVNEALKKPRKHPFVIFLDLNLPPSSLAPGTEQWFRKVIDRQLLDIDRKGEDDPWDLIVFSNYPDHYATGHEPAPDGYALGLFGKNPRIGSHPRLELIAISSAANKFGTLPNQFEEM
jgi:hypothetical protein